jgi:2-dehydro-3-deoxyphosphooctonate aldolase (KDO 8-P synthase)
MNADLIPNSIVEVGQTRFGNRLPLTLIAGPCALESRAHALEMAQALKEIAARLKIGLVYKTSFDKANRTSSKSARGMGLDQALPIFADIRDSFGVAVLTDVHEIEQCARVAPAVDVLQIPAFLCRQTDLLIAAAKTGRAVNIKKGQFLAPDDVRHAVAKVVDAGNSKVFVTERGTSFGYHNLVVDMRAFPMMRATGIPVVFDVTHSLQLPGGGDGVTAGQAEYIETLASAGVAAVVDGVFLEVHDNPARAKSDAQNALKLDLLEPLLRRLVAIDAIVKQPAPVMNAGRAHD